MTAPAEVTAPLRADAEARRVLAGSALVRDGGFVTVPLLDEARRESLFTEAVAQHAYAQEQRTGVAEDEDSVRGNPARWLEMAGGGPRLAQVYRDPGLLALLTELTGLVWEPSGGDGNYSYYRQEGHFLDVHRDADWCDLAVIVCVHDSGPPRAGSGLLHVYPGRSREPVSAIRRTPGQGSIAVRLTGGEALVLLGGLVAHRLVAVDAGHLRVVAPLCFQSASPPA